MQKESTGSPPPKDFINALVSVALHRRFLVLCIFLLLGIFGYLSWQELAIEAYPDIADTTAQVVTQYPGHAAEEVEEQVTIPIERELNGTPGLQVMRSRSTFGLSLITLVFKDGIDDYFARQRIRERLESVELPPGADTGLDPLTSLIGEIYRYTLESSSRSQRELRELQRWLVIPTLRQVPGVADVTNFGGETTEFQLVLEPTRLQQYDLSLGQVVEAVQRNNSNAGGSIMVRGDQGFVVRGIGLIRNLEDLGNIVVAERNGTPIFLRSLGKLQLGALQRNGILGKDQNPDGVSGIVLLLRGQNPSHVLSGIHERVAALNRGLLPPDVRVVPYLDRTELVHTTLNTVSHTMVEGIGLVCLVLILFLGSPRSALIVATVIPLSLLMAFILMHLTNIPANLLSLGAIDFGIIVDGAIVVMESILRQREEQASGFLEEGSAAEAVSFVARPIFFGCIIVITAYLPLFAFQRVERKLFTPMAYTLGYALGAALLVALTLIPGLALQALRKPRRLFHNPVLARIESGHTQMLARLLDRPKLSLWIAGCVAVLAVGLGVTVGKGFLPELDEGSLWLQIQLPPGLSLEKATEMANEIRAATLEFKPISYIVTQLGRNDDGTDSWTPSHIESSVGLRPYKDAVWRGTSKHELIAKLAERYSRIPGVSVGFSQPMIDGVNDKIAGAHSELVIKIFGDDLSEARRIANGIVEVLKSVPGSADVAIDQEPPLPQLQVKIDRAAAARFGINVSDVADLIEVAVGGRSVAQIFQNERRYDIALRFAKAVRNSPEAIADLTLTTASKARIPLSQVARLELRSGESTITRETNRRHLTVRLNLRGRDLSSFLAESQGRIARDVPIAVGYEVKWGGQFENQQRAARRLALILPIALTLIFILLYGAFGVLRHAALILINVPLALFGGMVALHLRGMTLNVSSAVGFIALFGVAVQNGVILIAGVNQLRRQGVALRTAVQQGTRARLRAVLMTATVATLGMLPAALQRGIGSDVQRPLATVVVGGLISATLLTLFVLPVLYYIVERSVREEKP